MENVLENIKRISSIKAIKKNTKETFLDQSSLFRSSMKSSLVLGQFIGVFPVVGVFDSKMKFKLSSWKAFFSLGICFMQLIVTAICFSSLMRNAYSITTLGFFVYYWGTSTTSILFLLLARKWQLLNDAVSGSRLDEYTDSSVKYKCTVSTLIALILLLLEHSLSIINKVSVLVMDCTTTVDVTYKLYIQKTLPWMLDLNIEYNLFVGILLQIFNLVCAINWSFSHIFIICISMYLSSIFEQINKKLVSVEGKYLPSSFWKQIREDYNSATRLVRIFDEYLNTITFVAFSSNLFFVCLQLYNVLAKGLNLEIRPEDKCPTYSTGPFFGYEHAVYFIYSLMFVLCRSLLVSLLASNVHSAALSVAPVLYAVPSPAYCLEVQRFIDQIHGDTVALTGMNMFPITRTLVISVAGTIVTYELVLLQFNGATTDSS